MDPSLDDIAEHAEAALDGLPEPFRALSRDIVLRVQEWPDADMLEELEIADPLELTGMYDGVPMTHKSISHPELRPDMIYLFRAPLLDELADRGNVTLKELVHHVVVHEVAHHFGWSDDDIAEIDRWWE